MDTEPREPASSPCQAPPGYWDKDELATSIAGDDYPDVSLPRPELPKRELFLLFGFLACLGLCGLRVIKENMTPPGINRPAEKRLSR